MLNYGKLPAHGRDGFQNYFEHGILGDFTQAILENNLMEALGRADDINTYLLRDYVVWLYSEAPAPSWGSKEKVAAWVEAKELERKAQQEKSCPVCGAGPGTKCTCDCRRGA